MASSTRGAKHFNGSAGGKLNNDGTSIFRSSTGELGTGTYTVMAQIAAEALSVPFNTVTFELGDTDYPIAPISAGSGTITTIGNAVFGAAKELQNQLAQKLVAHENSPFKGANVQDINFSDGSMTCSTVSGRSLTYVEALRVLEQESIEAVYQTDFNDKAIPYSMQSFGAHFAEVRIDPDLGELRLTRFVTVASAGRIMNEKTALSQVHGGAIMGIGMALREETFQMGDRVA